MLYQFIFPQTLNLKHLCPTVTNIGFYPFLVLNVAFVDWFRLFDRFEYFSFDKLISFTFIIVIIMYSFSSVILFCFLFLCFFGISLFFYFSVDYCLSGNFFLFNFIYLFIYFWLRWVFIAAHWLSLVVASGGYSLLWCLGFSLRWLLLLQTTGSRSTGFSSCGTRA